jgi:2-dehydropantoate 2-reductase
VEQARLKEAAGLLIEGGTSLTIIENIQTARWKKLIWNMAWNTLTTLTGADTETWLNSSDLSTTLTVRLMNEAVAVAKACAVPDVDEELPLQLIEKAKSLGPLYSSMYHDSRAGRQMEIEVIVGTPVRKGRELGVPVPTLEIIYAMLLAVEERLAKEKSHQEMLLEKDRNNISSHKQ